MHILVLLEGETKRTHKGVRSVTKCKTSSHASDNIIIYMTSPRERETLSKKMVSLIEE